MDRVHFEMHLVSSNRIICSCSQRANGFIILLESIQFLCSSLHCVMHANSNGLLCSFSWEAHFFVPSLPFSQSPLGFGMTLSVFVWMNLIRRKSCCFPFSVSNSILNSQSFRPVFGHAKSPKLIHKWIYHRITLCCWPLFSSSWRPLIPTLHSHSSPRQRISASHSRKTWKKFNLKPSYLIFSHLIQWPLCSQMMVITTWKAPQKQQKINLFCENENDWMLVLSVIYFLAKRKN